MAVPTIRTRLTTGYADREKVDQIFMETNKEERDQLGLKGTTEIFDDMDSATRINLWGCTHKEVLKRILDGTDMFKGFANIKQARDAIGIDVEWYDETRGGQSYLLLAFVGSELAGCYAGETLNKQWLIWKSI
jgi:hypothetical protein